MNICYTWRGSQFRERRPAGTRRPPPARRRTSTTSSTRPPRESERRAGCSSLAGAADEKSTKPLFLKPLDDVSLSFSLREKKRDDCGEPYLSPSSFQAEVLGGPGGRRRGPRRGRRRRRHRLAEPLLRRKHEALPPRGSRLLAKLAFFFNI